MKTRRPQYLGLFVILALFLARPVEAQLDWSTFLGGTNDDRTNAVARDPSGFVYVAGHTVSATFPTVTPLVSTHIPPTPQGGWDVFVCKLDPTQSSASQLLWCTIVGGNGDDHAFGIALDPSGNIVVTGSTTSGNFPTTPGCYDPSPNGGIDAFVLELSPTNGATLLYSTYLGGSSHDHAQEVDASNGLLTVAGCTNSTNFPTQNPYQAQRSGPSDVFVARIDPSLGPNGLLYSTYLGGSATEGDGAGLPSPVLGVPKYIGLHVDSQGVITVAGPTDSGDFPTSPGAYQAGSQGLSDAFVAMLDPALPPVDQLSLGTHLGGSGDESALTVDRVGPDRIVVGGHTYSGNLPVTLGAYGTTFGGTPGVDEEGFLAVFDRLQTGSSQLVYSTFVGGLSHDSINTLVADSSGAIVFGGYTQSAGFMTTAGALAAIALPSAGLPMGMVGRLNPAGHGACDLEYSTFLGGSTAQQVTDLAFDPNLGVFLAGMTGSADFPTVSAFQTTPGGGRDAWAAHLELLPSGTLPGGAFFGASRYGWGTPAAAAGGPVMSTGDGPVPGSICFSLICRRAPANASGFLGLTYDVASVSTALPAPFFVAGASVWLDLAHPTFTLMPVGPTDPFGGCVVPFPLTGVPASLGLQVITQFGWVDPVTSAIHTSDVLRVSI